MALCENTYTLNNCNKGIQEYKGYGTLQHTYKIGHFFSRVVCVHCTNYFPELIYGYISVFVVPQKINYLFSIKGISYINS